jgi:hypothetical protein
MQRFRNGAPGFSKTLRSGELEKRIAAYAAAGIAGAGLLFTAPEAEAEVVYTPAHVVIDQGSTYALDVNHDGVVDFIFSNWSSGFGLIQLFGVSPQGHINAVVNAGFCITSNLLPRAEPAALAFGVEIGKQLKFTPYGQCMRSDVYSDTQGKWQHVSNQYLGLGMRIDGELHYGWARLSTSGKQGFQAVLTGYAYETEAGKPIIAGNEGDGARELEVDDSTPESIAAGLTLGQLALGAAR